MKKFITFLICSFISVFCYSQTPNNTIITDTAKVAVRELVVGRLFSSDDSGEEEERVVKSDSVYRVSFGGTSIHPSGLCKKEKNNNHLDHAGNYLQRSIVYQISAIPCFAVSAILFVSGAKEHSDFISEHHSSGTYTDNSSAFYVIGGLFGAAGVFCEIKALQMTWKGGRELRLTGNGVVYKF